MKVLEKVVDLLDDLIYNKHCSDGLEVEEVVDLLTRPDEFYEVCCKVHDYYHKIQDLSLEGFFGRPL